MSHYLTATIETVANETALLAEMKEKDFGPFLLNEDGTIATNNTIAEDFDYYRHIDGENLSVDEIIIDGMTWTIVYDPYDPFAITAEDLHDYMFPW